MLLAITMSNVFSWTRTNNVSSEFQRLVIFLMFVITMLLAAAIIEKSKSQLYDFVGHKKGRIAGVEPKRIGEISRRLPLILRIRFLI
jgi:hypothetical protein